MTNYTLQIIKMSEGSFFYWLKTAAALKIYGRFSDSFIRKKQRV
jgi:hypothetical protein